MEFFISFFEAASRKKALSLLKKYKTVLPHTIRELPCIRCYWIYTQKLLILSSYEETHMILYCALPLSRMFKGIFFHLVTKRQFIERLNWKDLMAFLVFNLFPIFKTFVSKSRLKKYSLIHNYFIDEKVKMQQCLLLVQSGKYFTWKTKK